MVALDNLAVSQPRELFAGRYSLLNEREVGGQAIVNFARDRWAPYVLCVTNRAVQRPMRARWDH